VVAVSQDAGLARRVQEAFMCPAFRVYTNTDVIGSELGAALKQPIAIAAGICDGLEFGDNAKSALITRGLAEITRLGVAMGGRTETFLGLTGVGDLITTCISRHGRNRAVGERIARGETLQQVTASMEQVAEGIRTAGPACALAERHGVEMPITEGVRAILFERADPLTVAQELMERAPKPEHGDALD
jgi:glycerol-3-phosphate dehydrogenase (NAD(P)+)